MKAVPDHKKETSCFQFSSLDCSKAISIVSFQVGELGILNLSNSHENKTVSGLPLLNVEIHHYFKTIGWIHLVLQFHHRNSPVM